MDCASVFELEGMIWRCQKGFHEGEHGASGEKIKTDDDGKSEIVTYRLTWSEQGLSDDSEVAFVKLLETLSK